MCKSPDIQDIQWLIESQIDEATITDLLALSTRDSEEIFGVRLQSVNFKTKRLVFEVGKYLVTLVLPDFNIISRLKGSDIEKLRTALQGDIKVNCTCDDFKYRFRYVADQYGASTRKESRPPKITNPELDGAICKHITYLLTHIDKFEGHIAMSLDKSRENRYRKVDA